MATMMATITDTTEDTYYLDPPGCGCTDCLTGYSRPCDNRFLWARIDGGGGRVRVTSTVTLVYERL